MEEERLKRFSEIVKSALTKKFTSISYAMMIDDELVAADAIGTIGDKENTPATTDCTYNVASVSKIYCTTAVMQLVENGIVDLDTPVVEYLPRFKMRDARYKKITLRQCLNHSSGMPGTQWRGFSVSSVKNCNYYDDVYDFLSKSLLKANPGEYSVYCNDGFTVAEMVVAKVTNELFYKYCMKNITEPIGAHSTRLSFSINEDYTPVREKNKVEEKLLIGGGAGFTTTMVDLCKFGRLFLKENDIISEQSKMEMAKQQGKTFLTHDDRTKNYGLGWDNVNFKDPDYDLGDGVLTKGGNSFQFTTQFIVIPKFNAVLAISETHDCELDVNALILRLFATLMLEKNINIYKKAEEVPKEICEKYGGTYIQPSGICNLRINGAEADLTRDYARGVSAPMYRNIKWNGEVFEGENGQTFYFEEQDGDIFLMNCLKGKNFAIAMKAKSFEEPPQKWKERVNKNYIVANTRPNDLVIYEIMTGMRVLEFPNYKGVFILSFSGRTDSGVYGFFESSIKPIDDNTGRGFLRTPTNPSRDLIDPIFFIENKVEYCEAASYKYVDVSSLKEYDNQGFEDGEDNSVYVIKREVKKLPEIPNGRRIMIMDKDMIAVFDSMIAEEYKPVKEGYISFI